MRTFLATLALLAATTASAHAAGAYSSLAARDAAACARLCVDDGLCVAWAFSAQGQCDLRATTPRDIPLGAWGFSARAPGSLRQTFVNPAPAGAPTQTVTTAPAAHPSDPPPPRDDYADSELLGGPEREDALQPELRLGLRN
ncbi:MAG: hypothetical protein H7124_12770 [Phycisphaerales bacterium]|nr:hypothetical protein [Hyphomonadaceae bacterium]